MNVLDRLKADWEAQGLEKKEMCTQEELTRNRASAYVWASRIEAQIGRKVSQREIDDLMQF